MPRMNRASVPSGEPTTDTGPAQMAMLTGERTPTRCRDRHAGKGSDDIDHCHLAGAVSGIVCRRGDGAAI